MSRKTQPLRGSSTIVALVFVGASWACGSAATAPVISSGASTPLSERSDDPFARLDDRTVVPAFEFGVCESDRDCAPRGCDGSVCSPDDVPAVCAMGPVAECLAAVPATWCGCHEGACRWERVAPVMQCAVVGGDRPSNRPHRGADPPEMYPIRHD